MDVRGAACRAQAGAPGSMTDESLRAKLMGISQSLENTPVGSPTSAASSGDGTNPAQWAGPVPGVSDKDAIRSELLGIANQN
mmetsp:Transcript_4939/g.15156  ORF Transcript_4939/g.15156 Transcript_4939/m.15156 type:complete len:82 (-) Transcript_4939:191-436(-)